MAPGALPPARGPCNASEQVASVGLDAVGVCLDLRTGPQRIGRRLERGWYERQLSDVGPNVVEIQNSTLSIDRPAFDVTVPLEVAGQWLGDYHEGLDGRWLDARVAQLRRSMVGHW